MYTVSGLAGRFREAAFRIRDGLGRSANKKKIFLGGACYFKRKKIMFEKD
jgi:hypothetical protein